MNFCTCSAGELPQKMRGLLDEVAPITLLAAVVASDPHSSSLPRLCVSAARATRAHHGLCNCTR